MVSNREPSFAAALRKEEAVLATKIAAVKAMLAAYGAASDGTRGEQGSATAVVRLDSGPTRDAAILGAARTLLRNNARGSVTSSQILRQLEAEGIDLRVKQKTTLISTCLKRYPEFHVFANGRCMFRTPEEPEAVLAAAEDEHVDEEQALLSDNTPPDMGADEVASSVDLSDPELRDGVDDATRVAGDVVQGSDSQADTTELSGPDQTSAGVEAELDAEVEFEPVATDRDR